MNRLHQRIGHCSLQAPTGEIQERLDRASREDWELVTMYENEKLKHFWFFFRYVGKPTDKPPFTFSE